MAPLIAENGDVPWKRGDRVIMMMLLLRLTHRAATGSTHAAPERTMTETVFAGDGVVLSAVVLRQGNPTHSRPTMTKMMRMRMRG
jgi:hypothetical protein